MTQSQQKINKAQVLTPLPYIITMIAGMALEDNKMTRLDMAERVLSALEEIPVINH